MPWPTSLPDHSAKRSPAAKNASASSSRTLMYKRHVNQLCRGQYGRVFSVLAPDGRDDGGPAEEHAAVRAMVAGRVLPGGIGVAAAVGRLTLIGGGGGCSGG